jgi:hypothetical protein
MNKRLTNIIYSLFASLVFIQSANASLLTDPDGFSIELTSGVSDTNLFGPPSFTDNYDPNGISGNTIPAVMPGGTNMNVSFFSDYFEIRQFATSTFDATAPNWLMLFENIDSPNQIVGVSVDSSNTYVDALTASFSSDSISVMFAGGSTNTISTGGEGWFARVNVEFEQILVTSPTTYLLILVGSLTLIYRKHKLKAAV